MSMTRRERQEKADCEEDQNIALLLRISDGVVCRYCYSYNDELDVCSECGMGIHRCVVVH